MELSRRSFLGITVGGIAAAAAVRTWPFRMFSFPENISVEPILSANSIRYLRAFDPIQGKFISRFDVLYGWQQVLDIPSGPYDAEVLSGPLSSHDLQTFSAKMMRQYGAVIPTPIIPLQQRSKEPMQCSWQTCSI
jgi:hypothetical protein